MHSWSVIGSQKTQKKKKPMRESFPRVAHGLEKLTMKTILKIPTLVSSQERSDLVCALRSLVDRWPPSAAARAQLLHDRLLEEVGLGVEDPADVKAA